MGVNTVSFNRKNEKGSQSLVAAYNSSLHSFIVIDNHPVSQEFIQTLLFFPLSQSKDFFD